MEPERKIILSIETAIEGGSISIIEGKDEIDFWIGTKEGLKAEDFLLEISKILDKNEIGKKNIKSIIVSSDPGSSTGIKIGLATARGLGTALNCEVMEISLLEAILKFVNINGNTKAFVIFPVGKNFFFREKFVFVKLNTSLNEFEKIRALTIEKPIEELKLLSNIQIIVHRKIFESYTSLMSSFIEKSNQLIVFEENMAFIIAKLTFSANASDN
jgi:tRNA threonylcarbamoyl adenosine modification protein YeaZ